MNKNVKRIVAMAVAIGAISAAAPATSVNLLTTKVYASNDDADELDSITLQDDDDDDLTLYTDDDYDDDNEVDEDLDVGDTYYTECDTDTVKIDDIDGADEDKVRIFVGDDDYAVGDSISIDDDETTTLKVRVYEDDYDDDDDYSSSDYNEYKIKVEYTDYDEDDDDDNDDDELDSLKILDENNDSIQLYEDSNYKSKVSSSSIEDGDTYYAKTSSDTIDVKTDGPDDDYVKIFKSTSDSTKGVDPGDDISITSDKTLTVRVYNSEPDSDVKYEDDDDMASEYKIKLKYTANDSTTSESTTATKTATSTPSTATNITTTADTDTTAKTVKSNQWVKLADGNWQYYDAAGNVVKNGWSKSYYLNASGNMATGWLQIGGAWYYFGTDGAMKTGWVQDRGTWYYLYQTGKMAYSTTINGYKLNASGAWVK